MTFHCSVSCSSVDLGDRLAVELRRSLRNDRGDAGSFRSAEFLVDQSTVLVRFLCAVEQRSLTILFDFHRRSQQRLPGTFVGAGRLRRGPLVV